MNKDSENIKIAKQERERYIDVLNDQTGQLDKYIILASGTLFNVSIVFIDKIVPLYYASYVLIFSCALVLLVIAFFATLGSFWASAKEAEHSIDAMDECISEDLEPRETHKKHSTFLTRTIKLLNSCSFFIFFLAVSLLTFFIVFNIMTKGDVTSKNITIFEETPNEVPVISSKLSTQNKNEKK